MRIDLRQKRGSHVSQKLFFLSKKREFEEIVDINYSDSRKLQKILHTTKHEKILFNIC